MPTIYVLAVPEFAPVVEAARQMTHCVVEPFGPHYIRIRSDGELVLRRREMKMKPAVWYGLFTGGLQGRISEFGRDEVRVSD